MKKFASTWSIRLKLNSKKKSNWTIIIVATALAIITLFVAAFAIDKSEDRGLTELERTFLWVFGLATAIISSYLFTTLSNQKSALKSIIIPLRAEFRTLFSLYKSLSRIGVKLSERLQTKPSENDDLLWKLQGMIEERILTLDDALKNWRDIIPEDVEELWRDIIPEDVEELEQRTEGKGRIQKNGR